MAASGLGEHWRAELPHHAVLCRLRDQAAEAGPRAEKEEAEAAGPSLPRALLFGVGGDLFLWDGEHGAFYTLSLRRLGEEPDALGRYQKTKNMIACKLWTASMPSRPDLKGEPLQNADIDLYTDGGSFM